ncbi:MAG: methionine--tRNA ligase [Deltaproteobacteria bacterium]|nr:methionine--tRNA ligase [Deltaproteobacteria bacterium]
MRQRSLYITTAIDYVNSAPHIGTAYEKIGADVIARFARLQGRKVWLQMGNDEHSANVRKAALKQGMTPLAYCRHMENTFKEIWKRLDISYDGFLCTRDTRHAVSVTKFFQAVHRGVTPRGAPNIYKKPYAGWYCESCEAFYTEKDLAEAKCPVHKLSTQWVEEENYFFALSHYQDRLLAYIKKHPAFILPQIRRNEMVKLIESGLEDISISRVGRGWGIPVPIDAAQTVYVWFDALLNYVTAVGYGTDPRRFAEWWKRAEVRHVIGKDITRFHCVIWPAMLMAAKLPLPRTIFGHGFVYQRGEKMSKTLGNVIDPLQLVERFGPDPVRYFLLRENSFGRDADFTWERFIERYNSDLANGIGNLVSRTVGMLHRYCGGAVTPMRAAPKETPAFRAFAAERRRLASAMERAFRLDAAHDDIDGHDALAAIWQLMTAADLYINNAAPWERHKRGETATVAYILGQVTEAIRVIAIALAPFMPGTAKRIWDQLGFEAVRPFATIAWKDVTRYTALKRSVRIAPAAPLFPKIEDPKEKPMSEKPSGGEENERAQAPAKGSVQAHSAGEGGTRSALPSGGQAAALPQRAANPQDLRSEKTQAPVIDISDFAKCELRIATVLTAERIEGTDKLLRLQVDLGNEQRQIVAGIAQRYPTAELIGQQVVVVTNLKPARLRGVESQGMLLAAGQGDTLAILSPTRPVPNGAKVK